MELLWRNFVEDIGNGHVFEQGFSRGCDFGRTSITVTLHHEEVEGIR
jgi:hypothetical protein